MEEALIEAPLREDKPWGPDFDAKIVGVTAKAAEYGIGIGSTGREAVERMLEIEEAES